MKLFLTLLTLFVMQTANYAQSHHDKVNEIDYYTVRMVLTDKQIGQTVKIINTKYEKYKDFVNLKDSNPDEYYAKLEITFNEALDALEAVMQTLRQKETFILYRGEILAERAELLQTYQAQGMNLEEANNQYFEEVFFL